MLTAGPRAAMTLRATIDRPNKRQYDGWGGQPAIRGDPERIHEALPCRYWTGRQFSGAGYMVDDAKTTITRYSVLMVPLEADVEEGDIIVSVVNRRGARASIGFAAHDTVRVQRVIPAHPTHQELRLESFHDG